jgi:hypothetical protein
MINISQQPPKRPGLRWYSKILLFLMTLVGIACIGVVTLLYFGYSIPGLKVPPYLSFLFPPASTPMPYYTPTITPTYTNTPGWTFTPSRTAVPSNTIVPTRTKAATWTLVPMLITPTLTATEPFTPTVSGTPPTETPSP